MSHKFLASCEGAPILHATKLEWSVRTAMFKRLAQLLSLNGANTSAARQPFLRSSVSLGNLRKSAIASSILSAPVLIEEASWYADQQWKWTGVALAGERASEGLWAWQVRRQQEEREHGRQI